MAIWKNGISLKYGHFVIKISAEWVIYGIITFI
jgi:hypothetical protein